MSIELNVNDKSVTVAVTETTPLLHVLRNLLDLKARATDAAWSNAAVCMVLVDGEPVYACTREIGTLAGRRIATIESLGGTHPLQTAFLEEQAGQCAYCLSGISCRPRRCWTAIPRRRVPISLKRWNKHLCRCGAHPRILRAVENAAAMLRKEPHHERHTAAFDPETTAPGEVDSLSAGPYQCVWPWARWSLARATSPRLAQIAADELDIGLDRIAVLSGDTQDAPDEGQTTIEPVDRSIRSVGAARHRGVCARGCWIAGAAAEIAAPRNQCRRTANSAAAIHRPGHDYWNFTTQEDFAGDIEGNAATKPLARIACRQADPTPRPAGEGQWRPALSTTWFGRTCCTRASCASPAAAARLTALMKRRCAVRLAADNIASCGWQLRGVCRFRRTCGAARRRGGAGTCRRGKNVRAFSL